MSGSGKSSLAFDTIYAEGQRRLLASMSTFAKRFVGQLKKPDVDFVNGLSPVVSIDQKTVGSNPRSTVGTMTDISDYLRMLFATMGTPHCPLCGEALAIRTPHQMMEHLLSLPKGTEVEVRAPVYKIHGEDYEYLFEQIRVNGYRRARIDGKPRDLGEHIDLDEDEDAHGRSRDRFVRRRPRHRPASRHVAGARTEARRRAARLSHRQAEAAGRRAQEVLRRLRLRPASARRRRDAGVPVHVQRSRRRLPDVCRHRHGHARASDAARARSEADVERGGVRQRRAGQQPRQLGRPACCTASPPTTDSASTRPSRIWPRSTCRCCFYGTKGEQFEVLLPPGAKQGQQHAGKKIKFNGVVNQLEHHYRQYRKQGTSNAGMDEYLKKVMVEYDCPECGGARLKRARRLVTIDGRNLYEVGEMHLADLLAFLKSIKPTARQRAIAETIVREVTTRLELLDRDRAGLPQPESPVGDALRRRIAAHPAVVADRLGPHGDALRARRTEHRAAPQRQRQDDRDAQAAARPGQHRDRRRARRRHDPGGGSHPRNRPRPGRARRQDRRRGAAEEDPERRQIAHRPVPQRQEDASASPAGAGRRAAKSLVVRGARQNNLKNIDVEIPLEQFVCVTGASGSGKSSLIHEIVQKRLYSLLHDSRVLAGDHDELTGSEHISDVIDIDQSPIGRSSRSNPATYIGFYDAIRTLFAETDEAKRRGFTASTFSFNVKGGRCEECTGEGTITTQLSFMPDVEVLCPTCKGARYNQDTLEVKYQGKNIAEVLDLSVEEGVEFFADQPTIARKIAVLNELGLGYLKLGHPSTILSGGEAQRVKLAGELGKLKRGKHNLYILDEPTTGLHFADIDRLLRKPEPAGRHRPFGRRDRAQPGRDQDGRSRHRPRPGRGPQRRPTDRLRHSRGDRGVQGVAHRQGSGELLSPR